MQSKTFEVRDNGTLIPVLAVRLEPASEADRRLLEWSGYGSRAQTQAEYVLLAKLYGGRGVVTCDPADWNCQTMTAAHEFIIREFANLESGAVVDSAIIRNEDAAARSNPARVPRKFVASETAMPDVAAGHGRQTG